MDDGGLPRVAPADDWAGLRAGYRWDRPARFNIAWAICGRWAETAPDRLALIDLDEGGRAARWTYGALWRRSGRLANVLAAHGIGCGDRVAVLAPQSVETLLTHLAAYRLGAIVTPLFTLFGVDALAHRLADSGAKALVTRRAEMPKIAALRDRAPDLAHVFCADGAEDGAAALAPLLDAARDDAPLADTGPDDPALISYTSGTTGPAKGALHGHRVLAAHVAGARAIYDFPPRDGDLMWTPADWAWLGGSMNAMAPALALGVPLLAHRMARFDPEAALALIADREVTLAFLPPTAMKLMSAVPDPARFGPRLRAVGAAGEAMGAELLGWGRRAFGLEIAEFYGQTECNMVIGNAPAVAPVVPGAMGRAMPGHEAAVLGADGPLDPGETGELAVRRDAPGMFLGYWNQPQKTAERFRGDWMLTGDVATRDEAGVFRFSARADDVITSSGYRIGPAEVEDCLAAHPAVAVAAVVGRPDPVRTEAVVAFVKPLGARPDPADLIAHVRDRLSPHLAPAEVIFTDEIPMTATGKIRRRDLRAQLTKDVT